MNKSVGLSLFAFICLSLGVIAQPNQEERAATSINAGIAKAASCSPATSLTFMELNNVRALIHTGGNLWQVPGAGGFGSSMYEVPKGSGIMAVFAGSLWLGGVDVNGQLKLAALRYRSGNDYWPGPLTISGDAEVGPEVCAEFDQHYVITKQEVEIFDAWYNAGVFDDINNTNTQIADFPAYTIPEAILNWPAHGDVSLDQDFYLAPFYDRDGDGIYNTAMGDYPWYDLEDEVDCQSATDRRVTLFGDQTFWWIFNDKGNIHTETGGDPIGMEIRAQAFAFATNDEVNSMTFMNYELINRGTQTLYETYFGQFIDAALGGPFDDYVGCDVGRGLGYVYNGRSFDAPEQGYLGYGANPPACGVDFFEGPYQDNDGVDNAIGIGPNEAVEGNGLGYGDGIADNERFGMRHFLYYNNTGNGGNPDQTDPINAVDYYNYLKGFWKDGTRFVYGGNGHIGDPDADPTMPCDFMFPGDSDPLGWGTGGNPQPEWTEESAGNLPYDRRFVQSAGPFVLVPGAVNNITVGVVYGRAYAGTPFASVEALRVADDKAQALFENCFKVLDGPDAPDISIQELDRELIVTLTNGPSSNNANEDYVELDPFIPESVTATSTVYEFDSISGQWEQVNTTDTLIFDRNYTFQGYQLYQVKHDAVGPGDIDNPALVRLVAQCDLEDDITQIINFDYNDAVGAQVPVEKVNGVNEGVSHSFRVTDDLFAQGDRLLINHKTYHFMAIAYAYNNYKTYDPNNASDLDGQKKPYKASRKGASGAIRAYAGIPHIPSPEAGGTIQNSEYGDGAIITRIEGQGNGGINLELSAESEAAILASADHKIAHPTYVGGAGPIGVKVIDPLNVPDASFELAFVNDSNGTLDNASWILTIIESNDDELSVGTTFASDRGIEVRNEQLFPELGISITVEQTPYFASGSERFAELISATIEYADSSHSWLTGVVDLDGESSQNWIRSGLSNEATNPVADPDPAVYRDYIGVDDDQVYETLLGGWWAPWRMVADENGGPIGVNYSNSITLTRIADVQSVDLVITSDQSKWTRCAVLETNEYTSLSEGGAIKSQLRSPLSVGKDGLPDGSIAPGGAVSNGMGWFPGYAINLETGERLNMAFGEDSWLAGENGRDMIWNPSARDYTLLGSDLFAGKHYIYIFNNQYILTGQASRMPNYDGGAFLEENLNGNSGQTSKVWRSVCWVGLPMLAEDETLLSNDVRIRLRVVKPYESYDTGLTLANNANPLYQFGLGNLATTTTDLTAAEDALDLINVVPNPYYAYSVYEQNRLDNRVKITNLPDICTVRIYSIGGTLIRSYEKGNSVTSLDWDLKNQAGVPIAGGVYLIHVNVPDVGEKVIKWFGALRALDVESF
jgi:hypothetical protein